MARGRDVKVPVSERALVQRINRKLKDDSAVVKKARRTPSMEQDGFGRYFRLDYSGNRIVDKDVDLEVLGRDVDVLRPYEGLAQDN